MAMSPLLKMQNSIERSSQARKKAKLRRQDKNDLKNTGIYVTPEELFIDEDGNYRDDVAIPAWFKNLSKAWQSNKQLGAQRRREKPEPARSTTNVTDDWNQWCDDRVEMLGQEFDPRNLKRKPGRPRLADHLKKQNPRIKRSDEMKALLAEKGIEVGVDGKLLVNGNYATYQGWLFQPNGRIKFLGDAEFNVEPYTLSAHQFLSDYC